MKSLWLGRRVLLRAFAFAQDLAIGGVAEAVINRTLRFD
jgi:hypothetical protein